MRRTATVLGSVKGRAPKRAPQAVSSLDRSCALRRREDVGTKGSRLFDLASGGSNKGEFRKKAVRIEIDIARLAVRNASGHEVSAGGKSRWPDSRTGALEPWL
jgi:hypothetical protein